MATIQKILHVENKGDYALVHVLTDEGDEAKVYVGGRVQVFLDHGVIKAFVMKSA